MRICFPKSKRGDYRPKPIPVPIVQLHVSKTLRMQSKLIAYRAISVCQKCTRVIGKATTDITKSPFLLSERI